MTGRRLTGDWLETGQRLTGDWLEIGRRLPRDCLESARRLPETALRLPRRLSVSVHLLLIDKVFWMLKHKVKLHLARDLLETGQRLAGDWPETGWRLARDWLETGQRLAGDWPETSWRLAGDWLQGVGKTTSLLSARFRRIFIAIKWKNCGK